MYLGFLFPNCPAAALVVVAGPLVDSVLGAWKGAGPALRVEVAAGTTLLVGAAAGGLRVGAAAAELGVDAVAGGLGVEAAAAGLGVEAPAGGLGIGAAARADLEVEVEEHSL